jgi:integrase
MGMIYKRGKVYWIKYYRNGKPYRESVRSNKEADAKKLLKKREGEIGDGKLPGIYFDKVRFDELAEDFLRDYRINGKKSLKRAEASVNHLKTEFKGVRIPDITTPRIQAYIEKRFEEDASNGTINRELSALKRMLNLGARQTPPKVDRVPYIFMLKENNTRKGFFEHRDYLALKDALPDYLKPILTFGYMYGWRINEILSLTWDRVDIKNGIVRLEAGETKNDQARTVYLNDELKDLFKILFSKRRLDTPFIFLRNGEPIKGFRKAWLKACKETGLNGKIFHDLRRTAYRNKVRAGVPERVAMQEGGWKTRSVADRYNIVSDEDLRLASKKLETYLNRQDVISTGTISGTVVKIQEKRANH